MTDKDYSKKWYILAAVSASALMGTIDASIVNIALPTLSRHFSIDISQISLAVSSYLLVITTFLIVAGRFGDLLGRKMVFISGLAVFTVGSVLCGLSQSFYMLVGARVVQAMGGSMIAGNSSAIITDSFPTNERGKALGLIGTVVAIGLTMGPPLGGFIIEWLGWRFIFFVNIPVGIAAMTVCFKMIPKYGHSDKKSGLDIPGVILLPILLFSLIFAIDNIGEDGLWNPYFIVPMAVFLIATIAFYIHESRAENPLINFELFFRKRFLFSNIAGFLSYFSLIFVILLIPFFNEDLLGLNAADSGKILLPLALVSTIFAPLSGTISDRIGQRVLASAGLAVAAIGLYSLLTLDQFSSAGQVAFRLIIIGSGMGFFSTPNNSAIMGALPYDQRGLASGMLATVRNLGMAIGVAIGASLFSIWKNSYLAEGYNQETAFLKAFDHVMIIAIVSLVTGVIFSLTRGKETAS
ncbi:MAG: DHA2 family efflux MFS transporter permease subunit [candidate division Zixibacteria bacterium]|nr:DHA2 family efflux MFS transporter permease subunit [candidate division Zixibacteria bacterium]